MPTRAILSIGLLALFAAGLLAWLSRTPESVRAQVPPSIERDQLDASLGARFTDEQVARHGAYQRSRYLSFALSSLVDVGVLIIVGARLWSPLVTRLERVPGGWAVRSMLAAAILAVGLTIASLPMAYVRGFAIQHAWGLSTQSIGAWFVDQARSVLIGVVIAGVAAVTFFGLVRLQPRAWWLSAWIAFTVLTALLAYLWPVVIAPLFNRFEPLSDAVAVAEYRALADEAGVPIDEVLVADASRRTTTENAYVAGLGNTKRLVLYDTLVTSARPAETRFVVAHELGHEVESHVLKGVLVASIGLLAGFLALRWLSGRDWFWSWSGASGIGDLRALPVLLIFSMVAGLVALPIQNAVSRRFEARADEIAIDLTDEPEAAVSAFRRLAFSNLADLRPPRIAVALFYSHPPIPERIRSVLAETTNGP